MLTSLSDIPSLPPNVHVMTANLHVPLRPSGLLQSDNFTLNDRFHPALSGSTFQALPDATIKAFEETKQTVLRHPLAETQPPSNVKILPLGTGSSIPTKYRNGMMRSQSLRLSVVSSGFISLIDTYSNAVWKCSTRRRRGYPGPVDPSVWSRLRWRCRRCIGESQVYLCEPQACGSPDGVGEASQVQKTCGLFILFLLPFHRLTLCIGLAHKIPETTIVHCLGSDSSPMPQGAS